MQCKSACPLYPRKRPRKRTPANGHVCFTPESGHVQCKRQCPLRARSGHHYLPILLGQFVKKPAMPSRSCASLTLVRLRNSASASSISSTALLRCSFRATRFLALRFLRLFFQGTGGDGPTNVCFGPIADIAYSITSSARESMDGGTVRPRALAVFRLNRSSFLVGACTGRSAGFSPLRIRST